MKERRSSFECSKRPARDTPQTLSNDFKLTRPSNTSAVYQDVRHTDRTASPQQRVFSASAHTMRLIAQTRCIWNTMHGYKWLKEYDGPPPKRPIPPQHSERTESAFSLNGRCGSLDRVRVSQVLSSKQAEWFGLLGCHVPLHILHLPASPQVVLNMLSILRPATRLLSGAVNANGRSFVSTVLLSKNWENETVADLRKELKKRGLTRWVIKLPSRHRNNRDRDAVQATNLLSSPVSPNTMNINSVTPWPLHRRESEGRHPLRNPRMFPASQISLPLHRMPVSTTSQRSCQT